MSEIINNSVKRRAKLKELILKLHSGESQDSVRAELIHVLQSVPYGDVIEVEQELINEGLPESEILKLCDIHSAVLHGNIDLPESDKIQPGHPVDVMIKENIELKKVTAQAYGVLMMIERSSRENISDKILNLRTFFNSLYDADKHYQRKEYLLFPYLEKLEITGPPTVMWGKHDEIRKMLKDSIAFLQKEDLSKEELTATAETLLKPALKGIDEMVIKEEEILFPMALDKLNDSDWFEISQQSLEIGFCLYDPPVEWVPEGTEKPDLNDIQSGDGKIQLPSGSFTVEELQAILNTLPIDMTFVDKNDKVKYFSQSAERIFQRNRAILNRDVRLCHPPSSTHVVDKILKDFKSGKRTRAPFWINMGKMIVHIEYFALRNKKGEYLGTLEVSHDIKRYKDIEGEQRILSYE